MNDGKKDYSKGEIVQVSNDGEYWEEVEYIGYTKYGAIIPGYPHFVRDEESLSFYKFAKK